MTTVEKQQLDILRQEVALLKSRIDALVPIDSEGEYKASYLKRLDRARTSKPRYTFKDGVFSRIA
jgi:hypothetical protein